METARMKALADGVFAIVMTLLVLELKIPHASDAESHFSLGKSLLGIWPMYVTYVISFLILGLFWLFHHSLFDNIKRANGSLLWMNIFFLMLISLIPFTTSLVAEHMDERIALILYGANWLGPFLICRAIFFHTINHPELAIKSVDSQFLKSEKVSYILVPVSILTAMGLSFIHVYASLTLYSILSLFYLVVTMNSREGISARHVRM